MTWGKSNIFFWSKLGLLLTLNIAFWIAWKNRVHHLAGFAPHFALLTWIALANLSGGECDTYYSHPNGSIGQMTLESMGFSILGLTIIRKWVTADGMPLHWPSPVGMVSMWHSSTPG